MYTKTIVCLANSKKTSGRCIAGKELVGGKLGNWIRPISRSPTHEISLTERRYKDGTSAEVLDIIEVPLVRGVPAAHQTENHLIAARSWRKIGEATWTQIQRGIDALQGSLWLDGHSTQHGTNDKVPEAMLPTLEDSLRLVKVANLRLLVEFEPGFQGRPGKRKVRASFQLEGTRYRLAVTDPVFEAKYLAKPDGAYNLGPATLCLSLSEPMFGFAFKLVATILLKDKL